MSLKCVVIDDEPLALELIRTYIARIRGIQLLHTFEDAIAGAEYLSSTAVDILFLDINMPDISGLDLAKNLTKKPILIFTTAYKQFAFEGFELEALDYLLKPIDFERFAIAVNKAIDYHRYKNVDWNTQQSAESVFVNSEYRIVKIALKDIEYIESLEDYVKIHLTVDKPVMSLIPLKKMLEKLPQDQFKRIHRSYVVPVAKVKSVQSRKMKLSTIELPVGDSYAEQVKEWIKQ